MGRFTTPKSEVTFAGIDFHKRFSVVALGDKDGTMAAKQQKLINDEQQIREFFAPYAGIHCAVESCRGYEWFVDLLKSIGLQVTVCDPRRIKLIAETYTKTDKRDARVLMELVAKGFLPACYQPTAEERALREQLRWRVQLMKTSTRHKLSIHALLDKENKGCADPFTLKGRQYLEAVSLTETRRALINKHLKVIDFIQEQLDVEFRWISQEVKNRAAAQLLLTIPGIGAISAMMILAELGDVTRFRKAEQVAAYLGLVPSENSSGDKRRLGGITKQGSKLLRWLLIQDAWQAIRVDPGLELRFKKVCARKGKQVAIVAVARKLSEIAFCVLRDQKPYDAKRLAAGSARVAS